MTGQTEEPLGLDEAMSAILALLVAEREERLNEAEVPATDVLLADAGLSYASISRLTRRPYKTVESTVRRARGDKVATNGGGRKPGSPARKRGS